MNSVDPSKAAQPAAVSNGQGLDDPFSWLKFWSRKSTVIRRWFVAATFWWAFWFAVVFIVLAAYLFPEQLGVLDPSKFLIAMAVFSTAIFALYAVLFPFLQQEAGLEMVWSFIFFSLVILYTVASFGLGIYYLDLALHQDPAIRNDPMTWINFKYIKLSIFDSFTPLLSSMIKILFYTHTFVFVFLILLMDSCAWAGCDEVREKNRKDQFRKICLFIDVPMVAGVAYANLIVYPFHDVAPGREYFLSGAVALQLLVANLQLLLFPVFNYFRNDTRNLENSLIPNLKSGLPDTLQQGRPDSSFPDRARNGDAPDIATDGHARNQPGTPPPKSDPEQDIPDFDGQAAAHKTVDNPSPNVDPSKDEPILKH